MKITPKPLLIVITLSGLLLPGCRAFHAEPPVQSSGAIARSENLQQALDRAKSHVFPALVFIKPIIEEYDSGEKTKHQVFGSGVIISSDGLVITNNHVVEKAVKVNCVLSDKDQVTAEVLGRDPDTDLALLRLKDCEKKIPLPFAEFADSDKVAEGDFVMALGSPFGFSRSISQGIISNTQRYLGFSGSQYRYNTWLQTDAAINPGNSGGPLVNMDGRIVGINTLSMSSGENIGFAIPSNVVKAVSERLQKNGIVPRCWTGLKLQALKDYFTDTFTAAPGGVLISNVEDESPARFAGVHQGDILLRVNSEVITGTYVEDLPKIEWILAELPAERAAKIEVLRGGKTETLTLMPIRKGKVEGDDFDCRRWNMTVKEINKHQDPMLYFFAKEGVFVQGVRFPGNAAAAGVISGDIVKAVDGHAVKTLKEIQTIYDHAMADDKREKKVLLELERNRQKRWVALDYAKDYEKEQ